MYLKVKTIKTVPAQYGSNIEISKVGLYDDNDKWVTWVKLDSTVIIGLSEARIPVAYNESGGLVQKKALLTDGLYVD